MFTQKRKGEGKNGAVLATQVVPATQEAEAGGQKTKASLGYMVRAWEGMEGGRGREGGKENKQTNTIYSEKKSIRNPYLRQTIWKQN